MKFKLCVCLVLLLTLNTGFANCNTIEQQAIQLMQKNKVNGMAIAIINQGNTVFEIASISKTFTATLAGIAAAQGVFDLQKPISDYVGALKINPIYQNIN